MPTTALLVCANAAIVDSQTNQLSLIEVYEEVAAAGFPFVIPRFCMVWIKRRIKADPDTLDAEIEIYHAKQKVFGTPVAVVWGKSSTHRSIVMLGGFVVTGPGELECRANIAGKTVGSFKIPVTKLAAT